MIVPSVASALDFATVGVALGFLELKTFRLSFFLRSWTSTGALVGVTLAKTLKEILRTISLVLLYKR